MKQVALFIPEAHYNSSTGKIEFRVAGGDYASLTSFRELQELQKNVGEESKLTQSLLELKVTGAALRASIDAGTLYAVKDVRDYPSDTHSEVMDAVQTVEANLGFLSSLELPHDLSKLIKRSIPGRFTQWLQVYVDHKTNPWYARIAGAAGLIGGAASLIVGVPQMAYWASQGTIDLTYNPIIPNRIGNTTALVLTGEGFGAVTFSLLTLGSDIGSKLVRDIRKLQFHSLREV